MYLSHWPQYGKSFTVCVLFQVYFLSCLGVPMTELRKLVRKYWSNFFQKINFCALDLQNTKSCKFYLRCEVWECSSCVVVVVYSTCGENKGMRRAESQSNYPYKGNNCGILSCLCLRAMFIETETSYNVVVYGRVA